MSSESDSFLVEKLREILLGIYSPNSSPSSFPTRESLVLEEREVKVEELLINVTKETNHYLSINSNVPDKETKESILRKNLHEFIKVLKNSLNSDPSSTNSGSGNSKYNPGLPTVTMSDSDLHFNLSADDIADLNSLMNDDTDASVPIKHVLIIVSYFLIACVAIIGNLLVVQVRPISMNGELC